MYFLFLEYYENREGGLTFGIHSEQSICFHRHILPSNFLFHATTVSDKKSELKLDHRSLKLNDPKNEVMGWVEEK